MAEENTNRYKRTNLLQENDYNYTLQDIEKPNLFDHMFNYDEVPKITFNHRTVPCLLYTSLLCLIHNLYTILLISFYVIIIPSSGHKSGHKIIPYRNYLKKYTTFCDSLPA